MSDRQTLALFTTLYPGIEPYLPDWVDSVLAQTDKGFDVWVSSDQFSREDGLQVLADIPCVNWIPSHRGDSLASLRSRALERIVQEYEAVVTVDSDDRLFPERVERARAGLADADVYGCALRLMSESGDDLCTEMRLPGIETIDTVIPSRNILGLSNTAWRSTLLRRCLPLPNACRVVDWYLATLAWGLGASFYFDPAVHMWYRQRDDSVAPLLPPFSVDEVAAATRLVLDHYARVMPAALRFSQTRSRRLHCAHERAVAFSAMLASDDDRKVCYVDALNQKSSDGLWWSCVAHPDLESIWRQ